MEITYSTIKNIDQNSTAGNIAHNRGLLTKKIDPSIDVSSETAPVLNIPKKKKEKEKLPTLSPTPVSK